MKTAIIGGGAAGLAAAITLKRECPAMDVLVLEKLTEPARKILATGNGRCNLSNVDIDVSRYHGDSSILYPVLRPFGTQDCLDFFHSLGLLTMEEDGRIYPLSMNAATVRNVLLEEADRLGVTIRCGFRAASIAPGFTVQNADGDCVEADFVLLAPGGKADAAHGTDGDGYPMLKALGIRYAPISPALVPLMTGSSVSGLKGLRFRGSVSLLDEKGGMIAKESGELQFTEKGLSGIPAMQISGDAAVLCKTQRPSLQLDFCTNLPDTAVLSYLQDRAACLSPEEPALCLLTGLVQEKLGRHLLTAVGLPADTEVHRLGIQDLANLAGVIKAFPLPLEGTRPFKDAQVTRGGVPAEELAEGTLESRSVPGLWFAGELLNADGACGGYNLHFAWGSGILAAKEIAQRAENP